MTARHVFISGTNSGIGKLTALTLANRGHRVFATMRAIQGDNAAAALSLAQQAKRLPGTISVFEMELATGSSVERACQSVLAEAGHIDVVVNNAGLTTMGLAETMTDQQLLYQLDVNMVGPHRVLRGLLPSMRARGEGLLVHISDTLGRLVLPTMGVHCASKAGIEALMDAYRYELEPLGIETTIVEPGFHPTGFVDRLEVGEDHGRATGYGSMSDAMQRMGAVVRERITGEGAPDPQVVADTIAMLVEFAPGSRPERFVVDRLDASEILRVNDSHRRAQHDLLVKMGFAEPSDEPTTIDIPETDDES